MCLRAEECLLSACQTSGMEGKLKLPKPNNYYYLHNQVLAFYRLCTIGRVKDEKSQLGITAICFFGTILYGETEFTALSMF